MADTYLSDVFRFIQKFGQKGHQIGRKIGDAIEVVTMGMIHLDAELTRYCAIEQGLEGASGAEHKVEFGFYQLNNMGVPDKDDITKFFGFIECKKVGVEQTVKQSFKAWGENTSNFSETKGYSFSINPSNAKWRRSIAVSDASNKDGSILHVRIESTDSDTVDHDIHVVEKNTIIFTVDIEGRFFLLPHEESLHKLPASIHSCTILHVDQIKDGKIATIRVEDCLQGPQTPEKAKQASFVALDVRKRLTGHFDKVDDDSKLSSILVIGESSHWEQKSRSMINLCIDHNLVIPDAVVIRFFERALTSFGDRYQTIIKKSEFTKQKVMRDCSRAVIDDFDRKVLKRIDSNEFVRPSIKMVDGKPSLTLVAV